MTCSILAKPVHVDVNQKTTSQQHTWTSDVTLGVAEVVEALYGRTSQTHEFLSSFFGDGKDLPPEYCEVSASNIPHLPAFFLRKLVLV